MRDTDGRWGENEILRILPAGALDTETEPRIRQEGPYLVELEGKRVKDEKWTESINAKIRKEIKTNEKDTKMQEKGGILGLICRGAVVSERVQSKNSTYKYSVLETKTVLKYAQKSVPKDLCGVRVEGMTMLRLDSGNFGRTDLTLTLGILDMRFVLVSRTSCWGFNLLI